jgi:hypothetical protein
MKAAEKDKKPQVEKMFGMTFTLNEDLDKYTGPEFESPKLKKAEEKFKSGLKFKQANQ